MELDDLVDEVAQSLGGWIKTTDAFDRFVADAQRAASPGVSGGCVVALLEEIEMRVSPLAWLAVVLARCSVDAERVTRAISVQTLCPDHRLSKASESLKAHGFWLRRPIRLVAYAFGVGCAAREAWARAVAPLRGSGSSGGQQWRLPTDDKERIGDFLVGSQQRSSTPSSSYTKRVGDFLTPAFERWIPDPLQFGQALDRFEFVLCAITTQRVRSMPWLPGAVTRRSNPMTEAKIKSCRQAWERFWVFPLEHKRSERTIDLC